MLKAYKECKKHYFDNNKETLFLELDSIKKDLDKYSIENEVQKQRIEELLVEKTEGSKKVEERFIKEFEGSRTRISELDSENKALNNKISKLEQELQKEVREREKDKEELQALRELMFSLDTQEDSREESSEIDVNTLKDKRAILIGGRDRWQSRMKERLPNFIFVHPDSVFDTSFLDGVDHMFIFINYINHPMYYKAVAYARTHKIKLTYIKNSNEGMVLRDIYKAIS
jgi:hypothetical protein